MFTEAEEAFSSKDYAVAVEKIKELLQTLGPNPNKDLPLELLYFNIGLGYLLNDQAAEAEAAFTKANTRAGVSSESAGLACCKGPKRKNNAP